MRALVNTPGTVPDLIRECRGFGREILEPKMPLEEMFEAGFALPPAVGHLVSTVRSGIWGRQGREWSVRFAQSVAVGADFSPFADRLIHALLTDDGSPNPFCDPADRLRARVAGLYERRLAGAEPAPADWRDCMPSRAGSTDSWSFAAEAARQGEEGSRSPQALSDMLNHTVLERPPGLFKEDRRAFWDFLGLKCIEVAETCHAPADPEGEPDACVLRQKPDADYDSADVVCAGTAPHCLAMLEKHPDEDWCVIEGRDSLVALRVINAGVSFDDGLPMPTPFDTDPAW